MALKLRNKPIRNLKLNLTYIGDNNLFSLCGFANRGLICDELCLDANSIKQERPPRNQNQ